MIPLTKQVHELLCKADLVGETVIDATAGNGHDTLFLSRCVGPSGTVYAIDIQQIAIDQTKSRLVDAGCINVVYLVGSHAEMLSLLPGNLTGKVAAITFNLGYLPGSDKTITTQTGTTLKAIEAATELLKPGGILSIVAYTGHPGGKEEADSVEEFVNQLPPSDFIFREETTTAPINNSPRFFVIQKK